ncbi:MAG: GldG family protein [Anaerolineales bacterium]|nr:GldG family protein [Anaerolineales bacterium]MCX7753971.1 GldG family protein [Anaerolineales bacterium]MDW8276823.1 hypothetical protein [Anaerolineales bacterium]
MKSILRILLALVLFLLPIAGRYLMYHDPRATYEPRVTPADFTRFTLPEPPTPSASLPAAFEPVHAGKVVLLDAAHGNQYAPNEIEPLITALSARGGRVEFHSSGQALGSQLKYASAYIVFSPSSDFSAEELLAIQQFVESGGRLLVFADPTRSLLSYDFFTGTVTALPDVNYVNPLLAPYGMSVVNDYLYNLQSNEGNFRNVKFNEFAEHPLTSGLKMVVFYGVHSIQAGNNTALIRSDKNTYSSLTDQGRAYTPLAVSANGQVLAAGDFSFLTPSFSQVADNAALVGTIADFALGSKRTPSLVNFPYLFFRPVSLVTLGTLTLDANLLQPVAALQNALSLVNVPLQVREKAAEGNDVILLGTFEDEDAIAAYIKPFGISIETDAETEESIVQIRGIGKVSGKESGLLLFSTNTKANTLVLLAPNAKMLPELVSLTAAGELSSCVVQGSIGICTLTPSEDENGSFYEDYQDPYGG